MKIINLYKIFLLGGWLLSLGACTTEAVNQDPMVNLSKIAPNAEIRLADLNVAISRNRSNANLYARRAMLYLDAKATQQALTDIDHALTLDSDKGDYYFRRALILRDSGQIAKALQAAEAAEKLGVKDPEVYILLAELLIRSKKYPESLAKINLALNDVPTDEYALYYRGWAGPKLTIRPRPLLIFGELPEMHQTLSILICNSLVFITPKKITLWRNAILAGLAGSIL